MNMYMNMYKCVHSGGREFGMSGDMIFVMSGDME